MPAPFDTLPFKTVSKSNDRATFALDIALTNYSGTQFQVALNREVRLLDTAAAWEKLGLARSDKASLVAYETDNRITNTGQNAWRKETGLLSVWILGMFTPSPSVTIVVPIKPGPESELGSKITSYASFGVIPPERLKAEENLIYFRGDGKFRSKIGISPRRSKGVLGAYDADNQVLTIVQFDQPAGVTDYVNSLWEVAEEPIRRRRGQQLQRRAGRAWPAAAGAVLRDGVFLSGRESRPGREPGPPPPHHSFDRIRNGPGPGGARCSRRFAGGDKISLSLELIPPHDFQQAAHVRHG